MKKESNMTNAESLGRMEIFACHLQLELNGRIKLPITRLSVETDGSLSIRADGVFVYFDPCQLDQVQEVLDMAKARRKRAKKLIMQ